MSYPAIKSSPPHEADELGVPTRPVTLRDVIQDCGGTPFAASELGLSIQSVYFWIRQGRVPDSDLRVGDGRTTYADTLAAMQRAGTLSAAQIRLLGRQL